MLFIILGIISIIISTVRLIKNLKAKKEKSVKNWLTANIISVCLFMIPLITSWYVAENIKSNYIDYKTYMEDDFDQYGGLSREHSELINKHNNKIESVKKIKSKWFLTTCLFAVDLDDYVVDTLGMPTIS